MCGGDGLLTGLSTLIDNNLLRQEEQPDGEPRFTMLETIRAYALERLASSGERDEIRRRHVEYFLALARRVEKDDETPNVIDWKAFERELDNFRGALEWFRTAGDNESAVELIAQPRDATVVCDRLQRGRGTLARVGRRARRDAPAQAPGAPDPGSCQSRLVR